MSNVEKRTFWGYLPFDYRVSEAVFSDMSEKGWMVSAVSPYLAAFEACEPKRLAFRAAIYDRDGIGEKNRAGYIAQAEKNGNRHVCDYDRYYWFYAKGGAEGIDVPASDEKRLLSSAVWRKELYALILIVLAIGFGLIKLRNLSYISFVTYSEFARLLLAPVFIPLLVICGGYLVGWMLACRKKIRAGIPLPVPSVRAAKLRRAFVFGPVFLFFGLLILALILDACTGYARTVLLISPIVLVVCVAVIVRSLKKRGRAAVMGRILIILAMIACIMVYAVGNYRTFSSDLPEDAEVATLADMEGEHALRRSSYVHTASPAVKLHYIYKEIAQDGASANTEYFLCRSAFFADRIQACIEKALEGVESPYTLTREGNVIVYKELKEG